jgi:hypothetical protein
MTQHAPTQQSLHRPQKLSKFIAEEAERWGKVIRTTGAKPQ